jgi:PTH1 family peptidyl-tRNA hydrolase
MLDVEWSVLDVSKNHAMSAAPTFRLIVGLGNPGKEYRDTRHNVGFMILDRLAAREHAEFRTEKHWQAEVARTGDTLLCKPLTYMNLSGEAARAIGQFYKIEPAQTLVVLDDMALPLGKLRLRESGSAGGHNGLQSLIDCLGTQAIPRLRVGIGAAPGADRAVGHVLGKFSTKEREALHESLDRALAAIDRAQADGLGVTMNAFN